MAHKPRISRLLQRFIRSFARSSLPKKAASNRFLTLPASGVSVGDAGSGVEFNAKQILAAYGIDIEKDINKQNLGFGPSADALKDEKIDAFFCVAGIPTTAITDLAMSHEITVVPVDDDKFAELSKQYGFYTRQAIPASTYNGMTEDVNTVAVMATYIIDNDVSEETVYQITKAIFENKDAIAAAHTKGAELNVETAVVGIPTRSRFIRVLKSTSKKSASSSKHVFL